MRVFRNGAQRRVVFFPRDGRSLDIEAILTTQAIGCAGERDALKIARWNVR